MKYKIIVQLIGLLLVFGCFRKAIPNINIQTPNDLLFRKEFHGIFRFYFQNYNRWSATPMMAIAKLTLRQGILQMSSNHRLIQILYGIQRREVDLMFRHAWITTRVLIHFFLNLLFQWHTTRTKYPLFIL